MKVKYHLGWLELEQDNPDMTDIDVTTASLCHPLCQCNSCGFYQQVLILDLECVDCVISESSADIGTGVTCGPSYCS